MPFASIFPDLHALNLIILDTNYQDHGYIHVYYHQGLFTCHLVNVKTFAKAKSSWSNTTSLLLSGCYDEHDERMN